jgi:hypothetical protein
LTALFGLLFDTAILAPLRREHLDLLPVGGTPNLAIHDFSREIRYFFVGESERITTSDASSIFRHTFSSL